MTPAVWNQSWADRTVATSGCFRVSTLVTYSAALKVVNSERDCPTPRGFPTSLNRMPENPTLDSCWKVRRWLATSTVRYSVLSTKERIGSARSTTPHLVRMKALDSPMVANQKLDSYWTEVRCCRMQAKSNWEERRSMRVMVRYWVPLTKERIGSARSMN